MNEDNNVRDESVHSAWEKMLDQMDKGLVPIVSSVPGQNGFADGQSVEDPAVEENATDAQAQEGEGKETTVPEPVPEKREDIDAELQRLRSENGRAAKLSRELKEAQEQNAKLRMELEEVRKRIESSAEKGIPEREPLAEFSQTDRLAVGEDAANALGRKFKQADEDIESLRRLVSEQKATIAEIRDREHKRQQEAMRDEVERKFGTDIWDIVDTDSFKTWASARNPFTGESNGAMLANADGTVDKPKMFALLEDFVSRTNWESKAKSAAAQEPAPTRSLAKSANVAVKPATANGVSNVRGGQPKSNAMSADEAREVMSRAMRDPAWRQSEEGRAAVEAVRKIMYANPSYLM